MQIINNAVARIQRDKIRRDHTKALKEIQKRTEENKNVISDVQEAFKVS